MVSLSSRISPRASTVIFWVRSPWATAVVTWAMLRTWPVRLAAIEFTDSVRSAHVPETPGTAAWPPSLPSVPTSRATRVTSEAKDESWSTIALTVVPMRANSPLTGWPSISIAIFWLRSPSATATITRATSVVGRTRSSMRPLTIVDPLEVVALGARRPARARSSGPRGRSAARRARARSVWPWLRSARRLNATSSSPSRPLRRAGSRREKSPSAAASSASSRRRSAAGSSSPCSSSRRLRERPSSAARVPAIDPPWGGEAGAPQRTA